MDEKSLVLLIIGIVMAMIAINNSVMKVTTGPNFSTCAAAATNTQKDD